MFLNKYCFKTLKRKNVIEFWFLIFLFLHGCFTCMYVCTTYVHSPWRPKDGFQCLETTVAGGVQLLLDA